MLSPNIKAIIKVLSYLNVNVGISAKLANISQIHHDIFTAVGQLI
jgi:hypothetical protein